MAVKAGTALAAALAAAAVLVLTGCGPQQPFTPTVQTAKGLTAAGSARQVLALFHATQAVVGADGWYEQDNRFASCGNDGAGRAFKMFMARALPLTETQAQALVPSVRQVWNMAGIRATSSHDANLHPPAWVLSAPEYLTGTYPDGSIYTFTAGKNYVQFYVQGKRGIGPLPKYGSPDWPAFPTEPPTPTAPSPSAVPGVSGEGPR